MGIISDILEANKERVGRILSAAPPSYGMQASTGFIPTIGCPLCTSLLKDENELQKHILAVHRRVQSYLKLNGEVLQDVHYIEAPVRSFLVITLGELDGKVSISLSDGSSKDWKSTRGKPVDISRAIPRGYIRNKYLRR